MYFQTNSKRRSASNYGRATTLLLLSSPFLASAFPNPEAFITHAKRLVAENHETEGNAYQEHSPVPPSPTLETGSTKGEMVPDCATRRKFLRGRALLDCTKPAVPGPATGPSIDATVVVVPHSSEEKGVSPDSPSKEEEEEEGEGEEEEEEEDSESCSESSSSSEEEEEGVHIKKPVERSCKRNSLLPRWHNRRPHRGAPDFSTLSDEADEKHEAGQPATGGQVTPNPKPDISIDLDLGYVADAEGTKRVLKKRRRGQWGTLRHKEDKRASI